MSNDGGNVNNRGGGRKRVLLKKWGGRLPVCRGLYNLGEQAHGLLQGYSRRRALQSLETLSVGERQRPPLWGRKKGFLHRPLAVVKIEED